MRRRLSLALLAFILGGCFASNGRGRPDAGPEPGVDAAPVTPDDGPMCRPAEPIVNALDCPETAMVGEPFVVQLQVSPDGCCGSANVTIDPRLVGPTTTELDLAVTACDCTFNRCLGPLVEQTVEVVGEVPGPHDVFAADLACTTILETPRCFAPTIDEVRSTRALLTGQDATVAIRNEEALGCSCEPELAVGRNLSMALRACDCCEPCACIDNGYEGVAGFGGLARGDHEVSVAGGGSGLRVPIAVRDRDECFGNVTVEEAVFEDRIGLRTDGPRTDWIEVTLTTASCCDDLDPLIAFEEAQVEEGAPRHFDPRYCDPCAGAECDVLTARTATAWLPFRELARGETTIQVDRLSATTVIP